MAASDIPMHCDIIIIAKKAGREKNKLLYLKESVIIRVFFATANQPRLIISDLLR